MTTTTFVYTGAAASYVVPTGVTSVVIVCRGASGAPFGSGQGGTGATVQGTLAVTPGETLVVEVGGGGVNGGGAVIGPGGANGGGNGGGTSNSPGDNCGNGGGGASDVRQGGSGYANRVIVAGAGGAGGRDGNGGGGGALGGSGSNAFFGDFGSGGSQTAGGAAGTFGVAGALGLGGGGCFNSGSTTPRAGGGGGGAGLYGGGGGGNDASTGANVGGGGGGSSYAGGCTSTSSTAGIAAGNTFQNPNDAFITITTVDTAPNAPTQTGPLNGGFADVTNALLQWTFSDPDAGDSQSLADVRYRVAGTTDWITVSAAVGTVGAYRLTGLVIGLDYEWQVRTYDQQGTVGVWTGSWFFTPKAHPVALPTSPVSGQAITSLAGTPFTWTPARDQYAVTTRRVGDDGQGNPDTSNIIETSNNGGASTASHTFTSASHNDGPEHWQILVQTFAAQVSSDWVDIPVTMSVDAPSTPTCVATAVPNIGAISVVCTFAEASIDYSLHTTTVPTVADTGQALTTTGTPDVTSQPGYLYAATTVFSQSMPLAAKIKSMSCTFRQNNLGTNHTDTIYMIARDASNNAHIYCGIDAGHWYIKKDVAGTLTTLQSGALTNTITTSQFNAYPYSMLAWFTGTTVTFVDPWGVSHTATDAVIGSFTGTIAQMLVTNSGASDDTWKIAHFSADSTQPNSPVTGYVSRSSDGKTFVPIPGAVWDTEEYGSVFTYIDYAAPFNKQTWYQVTSVTGLGAIAKSAVS